MWLAQVVSRLGTQLTAFGIALTVLEQNDSVTQFSLTFFAAIAPEMTLALAAGVVVDRWNRRFALMLSHIGAGACTLLLFFLHTYDNLDFSTLLILIALSSAFNAFQFPAMSSATTLLVPKESLAKASGLIQVGLGLSQMVAPLLGGFLLDWVGLSGILMVDVSTFTFAVVVLSILRFPPARISASGLRANKSVKDDLFFGWRYIRERTPLLLLLFYLGGLNLFGGITWTLLMPLIKSLGTASELGVVISLGGVGVILGGGLMLTWGGPNRLILGILGSIGLQGILLVATVPFQSLWAMGILVMGASLLFPIIMGCADGIWLRKVPPDIQGKVLSFRPIVAQTPLVLAVLISGPLADQVFEPLMREGGSLTAELGPLFGTGPGRGIALLMWILGICSGLWALVGFCIPKLRRADLLLEDHQPLFGQRAIDLGFIDAKTLWKSLKWQRLLRLRTNQPWLLGDVMVHKALLSREEHGEIVREISNLIRPNSTSKDKANDVSTSTLYANIVPAEGRLTSDDFYGLNLLGDIVVDLGFCTQAQVVAALDQQVVEAESGMWRA
ncbi:MAG: MFS transporter, partial [Deltaproteobacteria bacterium]|nr:MFS transporter [Deltaproteobacteria bacterium]